MRIIFVSGTAKGGSEMNFEINKDDWGRFFDALTKRRFEWKTEIELIDPNVGDQTLSNGLRLNGITLENRGGHTVIDISVVGRNNDHQTHNVTNATRVAYLHAPEPKADVIAIEDEAGTKTLIRLIGPIGLLIGFEEARVFAQAA